MLTNRVLLTLLLTLSLSPLARAGSSLSFAVPNKINAGTTELIGNASNHSQIVWLYYDGRSSVGGDANSQTIIAKRDSYTVGGDEFDLNVNTTDSANASKVSISKNNTTSTFTGASAVSTGTFTHIAFTADATTATLYYNGSSVATLSADWRTASASTTTIGIGRLIVEATEGMAGKMAYLASYNRALSVNEIGQVMRFPGSITNGLKGFWLLISGSTSESDYSNNGHTGTVTGATASALAPPICGLFTIPPPGSS